tara:strand:- start:79588 stop:80034 length:447 start_codon:yes stop_codon:yes gene_type:complete
MGILKWGNPHHVTQQEIPMLDQLLNEHKDTLINALTSKLGVNNDQAGGFLIKVLPMIEQLLGDGKLDMSAVLKGDLGAVKNSLDLDMLGGLLGGGKERAEQGIDAIADPISKELDKLDDPIGMLGGLLGDDSGDLMSKAKKGLGGLLG